MKAAVMGAGSWGTTFAQVLCDAGTPATLWARRPELAEAINETHENADYLPGLPLNGQLRAKCRMMAVLKGSTSAAFSAVASALSETPNNTRKMMYLIATNRE